MQAAVRKRLCVLFCMVCIAGAMFARPHKHKPKADSGSSGTDAFYVLAMSWAPNYCDDPSKPHSSSECDLSRHFGFIVHGLWTQDASGHPAPDCTNSSPLSGATVSQLMTFIPDRGLIAHEWQKHLSCHFTPQNVVEAFRQATAAVKIPAAYKAPQSAINVPPSKIESDFAAANGTQAGAYRTSCHGGKLVNFEACLTADFKARTCGSMPECPAGSVALDAAP